MDSNENTPLAKSNGNNGSGSGDQPYGAEDVTLDMKGIEADEVNNILHFS